MWNNHIQWKIDNNINKINVIFIKIKDFEMIEIDKVREVYPHGY